MKQISARTLTGVLVLFLTGTFQLSAQTGGGEKIELIIEADREIEKAYRQADAPKIMDTVFPTPVTQFPLLALHYEPFFEVSTIQPATVNMKEKLPQLYSGYAKVGIGSVLMPLAEIYYNNTRTRKYNYGFHAQHLSSFGRIKGVAPANYDRTSFRAFGGVNEKKYDWSAELNYNNRGLHFYGFPNENANADSIAQRFSTVGFKAGYSSHKRDSLTINWKIGMEYRHFGDKKPQEDSLADWHATENYFAITGGAWYKSGHEVYGADVDLKYNGYQYGIADSSLTLLDSGIVRNNTLFSVRPYITTYAMNNRLKAKIGVDLTISGSDPTKAYIYPNAEIKYSMFNDILIPYGGVRGGMTQQTFKSITDINEFSLSNVQLRNEHKAIDVYAGLKGTLSRRIGFNLSASFSHIKDKALFITDTTYSAGNRFDVIYDTMNVAAIEGSLTYQMLEKTRIDVIGRYFSYNPLHNIRAWNLPQLQFVARASHNLYDKFIFNIDLTVEQGRYALVYSKKAGVIEENNQFAEKLGIIADVNLGAEYRYKKRVSAFINFNNLAGQRYKRWYNYPVQGFQVMGGVTVRF